MPQNAEKKFSEYWKNPEKVRERNRNYYYKKRGLAVPEKPKKYTLRTLSDRELAVINEKAEARFQELLGARIAELDALEKELKAREERIKKIEESYTLKAYQPEYRPPRAVAKKVIPVAPVVPVAIPPTPSVQPEPKFIIGRDDFK